MKLSLYQRMRAHLRRSALRDLVVAYRFRGVSPHDVIFASYPKSGATWLTFMLSDLLWESGERQEITDLRFIPVVGKQHLGETYLPSGGRILRTHELHRPCCNQALYVVRDGRDVIVSLYFHIQRITGMEASFSEFLEYYLQGFCIGAGVWHEHVANWLDSPVFATGRGLLIRYEDMKQDVRRELRRCAEFLGADAPADRLERAAAVGDLDAMRKTEKRSALIAHREKGPQIPFVRKGIVGDWQDYFSERDLERFNNVARPAMERLGYAT